MDSALRELITKPFDLGSFDKDIGWCGDWHTLTTDDGVRFQVLREADENGVRTWTQRFDVTLETLDREAGVVVLRGGAQEIVFDLRAGVAVQSAFTPAGAITLLAAPTDATLEAWLLGVAGLFRRLGPARAGTSRVEWLRCGEAPRAWILVGDEALAEVHVTGTPLEGLAIDGAPDRRLLLRWSKRTPRTLHVTGEILPRGAFLALRRALVAGLGWTPPPELVRRLLLHLAEMVRSAPEAVEVTTLAARGEILFDVRAAANALARRAPELVDALGLRETLAALATEHPEPSARELLATQQAEVRDAASRLAEVEALLQLEEAIARAEAKSDARVDHEAARCSSGSCGTW
jgi:hypothetical protein